MSQSSPAVPVDTSPNPAAVRRTLGTGEVVMPSVFEKKPTNIPSPTVNSPQDYYKRELTVMRNLDLAGFIALAGDGGAITIKVQRWLSPDDRPEPYNAPWDYRAQLVSGSMTIERYWLDEAGNVQSDEVTYAMGDVFDVTSTTFCRVTAVEAGTTLAMICGAAAEGMEWGYLNPESGEYTKSGKDPVFFQSLLALNPNGFDTNFGADPDGDSTTIGTGLPAVQGLLTKRPLRIPNLNGEAYKIEAVIIRDLTPDRFAELVGDSGDLTLKVNIWKTPDLRDGAEPMPHTHPWENFTSIIIDGGYTERRFTLQEDGNVAIEDFAYTSGDVNSVNRDVAHEVIAVDENTLTFMVCVNFGDGTWGYISPTEGSFTKAGKDDTFFPRLKQVNPHIFGAA